MEPSHVQSTSTAAPDQTGAAAPPNHVRKRLLKWGGPLAILVIVGATAIQLLPARPGTQAASSSTIPDAMPDTVAALAEVARSQFEA